MLVKDQMTERPITVKAKTPFQDALNLMHEKRIRRLPVVDDNGKLVGIVSERDLLNASPSAATTLSVWEMNYLLSKLKIENLMTKDIITVPANCTIENAAQLMVNHKFGGLPVVDEDGLLVGIITETDIFSSMVEMFGGAQGGLRLTMKVPRGKGVLAKLSNKIADLGGYIVSVGSYALGDDEVHDGVVVKVQNVDKKSMIAAMESLGDHVIDAREVTGAPTRGI